MGEGIMNGVQERIFICVFSLLLGFSLGVAGLNWHIRSLAKSQIVKRVGTIPAGKKVPFTGIATFNENGDLKTCSVPELAPKQ